MKVKIGNKIIDANDEPIMLIFNDDKEKHIISNHLKNMPDKMLHYCMYPNNMNERDIKYFMNEPNIELK